MFDGRDALASCQPAGSLVYSRSNLPILIKMRCVVDKDTLRGGSCAGVGRFVPDPVPYRSIPVPDPDQPCTTSDPLSGEQMAGSYIEVWSWVDSFTW